MDDIAIRKIVQVLDHHIEASSGVPYDVIADGDKGDCGIGCRISGIPGGQEDSIGILIRADPAVLQDVRIKKDVPGVLEFKDVLDLIRGGVQL